MFSFLKRKPSASQVIYRTVTERVPNTLDLEMRLRQENLVEKTTNEYVRLSIEVDDLLNRRDSGETLTDHQRERLSTYLGKMTVLSSVVAMATGKDHIMTQMQLETLAHERKDQEQPLTSWIAGLSPLWASRV